MKITNEFTVNAPIEHAWQVLTDLEGIAPCMPGARLTGVEGDVYKGKVKVKVGPVISEFTGTARFAEKDDAAHRAVIDAKGRDARAAGNATALVTAVLNPDGDRTHVSVDTDLTISGKLAQFGNRMIHEVSGKLLGQFVANLEAKLAAEQAAPAAESGPAAESVAPAAAAPAESVAPAAAAPAEPDAPAVAAPAESVAPVAAVPPADSVAPAAASPAAESAPPAAPTPAPDDAPESGVAKPPGRRIEAPATEPAAAEPAATVNGSHPEMVPHEPFPVARDASREPEPEARTKPAATTAAADKDDPEPLDLLSIAGSSIYKRAIPLVIGLVVVIAVIVWLIVR